MSRRRGVAARKFNEKKTPTHKQPLERCCCAHVMAAEGIWGRLSTLRCCRTVANPAILDDAATTDQKHRDGRLTRVIGCGDLLPLRNSRSIEAQTTTGRSQALPIVGPGNTDARKRASMSAVRELQMGVRLSHTRITHITRAAHLPNKIQMFPEWNYLSKYGERPPSRTYFDTCYTLDGRWLQMRLL